MNIYGQIRDKEHFFPGFQEVAEKIWFKEKNGKGVEFSHSWIPELFSIGLSLDKWLNDERWNKIDAPLDREMLESSITKIKEFDEVQFRTQHKDILTMDKRAFYIFVIEGMKLFGGLLSEDDRETWITVDEFEQRHQDILNLTYDEANEISLEEIKTMEAVKERSSDCNTEEEEKNQEEFYLSLDLDDDEEDDDEEE